MIAALLTLLVLGIAGIVVVSLAFALLGVVMGVVGFLLFKVAPLLLIGWVVVKLVQRSQRRSQISAADRRWLDG